MNRGAAKSAGMAAEDRPALITQGVPDMKARDVMTRWVALGGLPGDIRLFLVWDD
jgi:hypothetical protein